MLTLGIETSGQAGSLALLRAGKPLCVLDLPATGRRHARMLLPEIQRMLRETGIQPAQLDSVAVSIGPGSFTGLRVGVVCAKTLAYAIQAPLAAVNTHLAIAERLPADVRSVAVIDDALRGDIFVGQYRRSENGWLHIEEPRLVNASQWADAQTTNSICVGPGLKQHGGVIGLRLQILPEEFWHPTAESIARLGEVQITRGNVADVWSLEPHYIRRSYAEEKATPAHE